MLLKGKFHIFRNNLKISDFACETQVSHTYRNEAEAPIEATYVISIVNNYARFQFPLVSDDAVITRVVVNTEGKTIEGEVKEKTKAFEKYVPSFYILTQKDDAIASGHSAYLIELKQDGQFHMRLGQVAPKQELSSTKCICLLISKLLFIF